MPRRVRALGEISCRAPEERARLFELAPVVLRHRLVQQQPILAFVG